MPRAKCLEDLLRIRHRNRKLIDELNGTLGSALGFKRPTGGEVTDEPAVLIFVPRKIDPKWLDASQLIPKTLEGPDGLTCPTDVVEGGKSVETSVWAHDLETEEDYLAPLETIRSPVPLTRAQLALREQLRGWTPKVMPGAQLAAVDEAGTHYHGTLGCFARDPDGFLGLITNQHVADHVDNTLYFPETDGKPVAFVDRVFDTVSDEKRFGGIVNERGAHFVLDCAFAYLDEDFGDELVEPRLPFLDGIGRLEYRSLGEPLGLDLQTMGPVGRDVVGVGRTRSFQRGRISAFSYEWADERNRSTYTDYLIIGEDDNEFSDPGDSGKLIVTADDVRPVALLWGGWREQLRGGRQENWTYAIDINLVLETLGVEIASSL